MRSASLDAYSADLILPPFLVAPKVRLLGELSLDGIVGLSQEFSASLTATAIRVIRMTRKPPILVAQDLAGRRWQWPTITVGSLRTRDDIDLRSSSTIALAGVNEIGAARKKYASFGSIVGTSSNLTSRSRAYAR